MTLWQCFGQCFCVTDLCCDTRHYRHRKVCIIVREESVQSRKGVCGGGGGGWNVCVCVRASLFVCVCVCVCVCYVKSLSDACIKHTSIIHPMASWGYLFPFMIHCPVRVFLKLNEEGHNLNFKKISSWNPSCLPPPSFTQTVFFFFSTIHWILQGLQKCGV
jgi:hypothetical protein